MTTKLTSYTFFIATALVATVLFNSCLTGGTHGSIKYYDYKTNKQNLQRAVEKVIKNNRSIKRDTTKNYVVDMTNNKNDTIVDNYYNDNDRYVTIYIQTSGGMNEYTFQYAGDKKYWDTSKIAELSIAYAYDKDGKGGSEGHNEVDGNLKRKLLEPFEKEFINKVDKELGQKHFENN